jgi:hypothetical protein
MVMVMGDGRWMKVVLEKYTELVQCCVDCLIGYAVCKSRCKSRRKYTVLQRGRDPVDHALGL